MISYSYIISFIVITLLFAISFSRIHKRRKIALYSLILLESLTVLIFFTDSRPGLGKFPINAIFPVVAISFYLLYNVIKDEKRSEQNNFKLNKIISPNLQIIFGIILIFSTIILEAFVFDGSLSANSLSLIILGFYLTVYNKIKFLDQDAKLIIFIFLVCFCLIFPISTVIFQIYYNNLGSSSSEFNRDKIVYNFLGKPLTNLLTLLGYNVWSSGDTVFFIDKEANRVASVSISQGCSGLDSLYIFLCGILSYLSVVYGKLDSKVVSLLFIGIIMSYIANLIRMAVIILAGHYYGYDALEWAHANVGWLIFTFWIYLFWSLMDKYIITVSYRRVVS